MYIKTVKIVIKDIKIMYNYNLQHVPQLHMYMYILHIQETNKK